MNRSLRLLRPSALPLARPSPLSARIARPSLAAQKLWVRGASGKSKDEPTVIPTSKDFQHATSGAKEEVSLAYKNVEGNRKLMPQAKNVAKDFAEMISGKSSVAAGLGAREISSHSHGGSATEDFITITKSMFTSVPRPALYFGAAGLLPYLGTSAATVFLAREASLASFEDKGLTSLDLTTALSYLHTMEHVQITYGAIILSFLGALHWGMEFSGLGGHHGYTRLAIGTIPVLFAWPTTFLGHGIALAVQWVGFTGQWFIDQRASTAGWTPSWYSTYRFYLSIGVGFSIIATLAGTGYYGAGAGATTDSKRPHTLHSTERVSALKRLDRVKTKNEPLNPNSKVGKATGTVAGDMQVDENESGDSYLVLRNVEKEEEAKREESKKKEEAKKEKAKQQDKKDEHQQDRAPGTMKENAKDRTGANRNEPGGDEKPQGGEGGQDGKGEQGKVQEKKEDPKPKGETKGDDAGGGKSQEKKDHPDKKGEAGKEPTGKK